MHMGSYAGRAKDRAVQMHTMLWSLHSTALHQFRRIKDKDSTTAIG
jgi:hypothetical protein